MKAFLLFAFSLQSFGLPLACINTSYSRTDEVEITDDIGHLIIGAFAHHGQAFYETEVERCLTLLEDDANNFAARNDLGAAYTKLELWDKAQTTFAENEKRHPGKYKTASNLGVMYKKMGVFTEAEASIGEALQIKPGGHMGLGDYYLQMIQWLKEHEPPLTDDDSTEAANSVAVPTNNFLGVPYTAGSAETAKVANKEYVVTLIKNDMAFRDVYAVLGDILFEEKNYQMALRAYARASDLADGRNSSAYRQIMQDRQSIIIELWRAEARPGHVIEDSLGRGDQIQEEFAAGANWLGTYQEMEQELLEQGRDVSFTSLNAEAESRGLEKPRLIEAVHYEGTALRADGGLRFAVVAVGVVGALVLVVFGACVAIVVYFVLRKRPPATGKKALNA